MKKSRTCGHSVISMEFLPNFPHSFFRQISLNLPTSFAKVIFPLFSSYFDNNSYGNFSQNKKRHDARQRLFITYHISQKKNENFSAPQNNVNQITEPCPKYDIIKQLHTLYQQSRKTFERLKAHNYIICKHFEITKGQVISEASYLVLNSSKNGQKTSAIVASTNVRKYFVRFLEEMKPYF